MPSIKRVISLDTETTGKDFFHGTKPYFVTTCNQYGEQRWWRWEVDPFTRQPDVCKGDIEEIQDTINNADEIALHGAKFDAHALATVGVNLPWNKVRDTIMAAHMLASNHPHNLTDVVIEYLGVNILSLEQRVVDVTRQCRTMVKKNEWSPHGLSTSNWRLAEEGLDDMPSVNGGSKREDEKPVKSDMWLADAIATALLNNGIDLDTVGFDPSWLNAVREYANTDSAVTLPLWLWMEKEIDKRRLRRIYDDRMRLLLVAYKMERDGVTTSATATDAMVAEYSQAVDLAQAECLAVADQFDFPLELPDGAAPNDSMREFVWGSVRLECPRCGKQRVHKHWSEGPLNGQVVCPNCLNKKGRKTKRGLVGGSVRMECVVIENPCLALPKQYKDSGAATLDAAAMEHYATTLEDGPALEFVTQLLGMRSRQTACSYMRSYKRYWRPTLHAGHHRMHPSYNPTGTDHLRWSSANPNAQNISRKKDFNLCRCFGPAPRREWWSFDFKSIERRIPVYECGEPKMLEVFERPDEPPYWGNLYCLTASVLYPDEYWPCASVEGLFRAEHPKLYKRAKFFDLAKQYGCGKKKADLLSRVTGSYDMVNDSFPLFAALQQKYLDFARRWGYVETIPDRHVDAERGYPILVSRTEDGSVSGTTPFNYLVSGTAMQCTNRAMVLTDAKVSEWNAEGWDGFLTLQVHDQLVWDCPRGEGDEPWRTNLWRMDVLKGLMESVGEGINIPTPTAREYHATSYADGVTV